MSEIWPATNHGRLDSDECSALIKGHISSTVGQTIPTVTLINKADFCAARQAYDTNNISDRR